MSDDGSMSRPRFFPIQVDRLCRVRGELNDDPPFELDADGFLDASIPWWRACRDTRPDQLITPAAAADGGALVLLGEPGVGKTSAFRRLINELTDIEEASALNDSPAMLWVDGADLVDATFDELVGIHLRQLAVMERPVRDSGPTRLTLVIDQLDESPIRERLPGRMDRALARVSRGTVRVLIACRTADYPPEMTEVLARRVANPVLADLAPLTKAQATQLAGSVHDDGEALMDAAIAIGAGGLASVPLTLELLVRIHDRDGKLTGGPAALFAQGTRLLAEEPGRNRKSEAFSATQRIAVAGRVAARLLLSGRRSIWLGRGLDARAETDLDAASLAGGDETTASGAFEVTQDAIKETLNTALFTAHGQDRLGFRHSSLAAYLAARYVHDRRLSHQQLVSLFLMDAPDRDTASIPVPLRETAAWLIALDPANTEWLAAADPESLAAHSVIVDSETIRALVVARLLDQAGEVEISESAWLPGRWKIAHPGLADQLRPVLELAADGPCTEWSGRARVRLAVRLARDAAVAELAGPLLTIAEHVEWGVEERRQAAITAMEAAPNSAVPRLRDLLHNTSSRTMPHHEVEAFEGLLLRLLWPQHLTLHEMLRHVRPPRRAWVYRDYERFLHEMAASVQETDFDRLLRWAVDRIVEPASPPLVEPIMSTGHDNCGTIPLPAAQEPIGQLPAQVLPSIINRVLGSPAAPNHLDLIATLLLSQLRRYASSPIPAPLSLVDSEGVEPEATTILRRALAAELVRQTIAHASGSAADVWAIAGCWTATRHDQPPEGLHAKRSRLLDNADFAWALDQADLAHQAGEDELAAAMGRLAQYLFDGQDPDAFVLAHSRQDNPAWKHIRWFYDGVPLDSELADAMRTSARNNQPERWDKSAEFVEVQRERLRSAIDGDADAFWSLAWNLQFDPATGDRVFPEADDLRTFVGVSVLGDNAEARLLSAALSYLDHGHDHRDSWLGRGKINSPAWAGCLAITLLHHADRLDYLTDAHWNVWAAALLSPFTCADSGEGLVRRKHLVRIATRRVPTVVTAALRDMVCNDIARGDRSLELKYFEADHSPNVADTMLTLLEEISAVLDGTCTSTPWPAADLHASPGIRAAAIDTWTDLLAALVGAEDPRATTIAIDSLSSGTVPRDLAVRAGRILLRHDPARFWQPVTTIASADDDFSRELALACRSRDTRDLVVSRLDEEQLADTYRWLTRLFPPKVDAERRTPDWTRKDEIQSWRIESARALGHPATRSAVDQLRRLAQDHPADLEVAAALVNARRRVQATQWAGVSVDDITEILTDPGRRLVRSNTELAKLLLDTLDDIARDLPTHNELLWNHTPAKISGAEKPKPETWAPKFEAALSAYLAHELAIRLRGRGMVINREVLVQPRNAYGAGDRTDILVQTANRSDDATGGQFAVVIEVKPTWNTGLGTSQDTQLVRRYLPEVGTDTGIYVVGHFPVDQWTSTDGQRKTDATRVPQDILETLKRQAQRLNDELGVHTTPFMLTIDRPQVAHTADPPRPARDATG